MKQHFLFFQEINEPLTADLKLWAQVESLNEKFTSENISYLNLSNGMLFNICPTWAFAAGYSNRIKLKLAFTILAKVLVSPNCPIENINLNNNVLNYQEHEIVIFLKNLKAAKNLKALTFRNCGLYNNLHEIEQAFKESWLTHLDLYGNEYEGYMLQDNHRRRNKEIIVGGRPLAATPISKPEPILKEPFVPKPLITIAPSVAKQLVSPDIIKNNVHDALNETINNMVKSWDQRKQYIDNYHEKLSANKINTLQFKTQADWNKLIPASSGTLIDMQASGLGLIMLSEILCSPNSTITTLIIRDGNLEKHADKLIIFMKKLFQDSRLKAIRLPNSGLLAATCKSLVDLHFNHGFAGILDLTGNELHDKSFNHSNVNRKLITYNYNKTAYKITPISPFSNLKRPYCTLAPRYPLRVGLPLVQPIQTVAIKGLNQLIRNLKI